MKTRMLLRTLFLGVASLLWMVAHAGLTTSASERPATQVAAASSSEAQRVALVIGNAAYRHDPLGNPINDARAMSRTLHALGFHVIHLEDASRQQLQQATQELTQRLAGGGVGLFYFSGHGMAMSDKTLLLPVNADSHAPKNLPEQAVELQSILDSMAAARPGQPNLAILDICLTSPSGVLRDARTRMTAILPEQTLVAYATSPGSFAADGVAHGIYTAELLRTMATPHQNLAQLFQRVESAVRRATDDRQVPWVSSSLSTEFRFVAGAQAPPQLLSQAVLPPQSVTVLRSRAILPKDTDEQYEIAFWESIKDSNHPGDYEAYLETYPKGRFAALARARLARLRAAAPKPEAPAASPPAAAKPAEKPATARTPPPEKPREPAQQKAQQRSPAPKAEQARPAPIAPAVSPEQRAGKPPVRPAGITEIKDCPACPVLISLPGGTFSMGSKHGDASEKPAHQVSLGKPFAIGKYEVTNEQWDACVAAGDCPAISSAQAQSRSSPVRDVSWNDAQVYLRWLSKVSGKNYRLPTEAEWEFAARGDTASTYWWGEQMRPGMANCKDCGEPWQKDAPADAGSFAPNPYGIYDMNGSVWEWVSDCWHNSYAGAPPDGRSWDQPNCRVRVIRGGSWRDGASYMSSSTRFKYDASVGHVQNGFRAARSRD